MLDETDFFYITLIGVGTTGLDMMNQLVQLPLQNTIPIICHRDGDFLRASHVPNRVLFEAGRADEDADWHLASAFQDIQRTSEFVIVITDLANKDDCRLASALVRMLTKQGAFTIAAVGIPPCTDQDQHELANQTVQALQHQANSIWLYELDGLDAQERLFQLAGAIGTLAEFCQSSIGNVDFIDFKKVMRRARMAVATASHTGDSRALIAVSDLIDQLKKQTADGPGLERILLLLTYSDQKPLLVREQLLITKAINEFLGKEAKLFKMGLVMDNKLGERLDLTILAGMPIP